jgi:hypothetical protein
MTPQTLINNLDANYLGVFNPSDLKDTLLAISNNRCKRIN